MPNLIFMSASQRTSFAHTVIALEFARNFALCAQLETTLFLAKCLAGRYLRHAQYKWIFYVAASFLGCCNQDPLFCRESEK